MKINTPEFGLKRCIPQPFCKEKGITENTTFEYSPASHFLKITRDDVIRCK